MTLRLRSRTKKRQPHRLEWGPAVSPEAEERDRTQRRAPVRSLAHKRKILDTLVEFPEGLLARQLAEVLGVSEGRTATFLAELQEEGLVAGVGRPGQKKRWVADV